MTRIALADDHAIVLEGLKVLLSMVGDMIVVATAVNGAELEALLARESIDLLVLDLQMPGVNGVPYVTALRARHPGLLILVLTGRAEPHVALSVLDAGANGYLAKGANIDQLLPAIDALLAGQRYVDTQVSLSEAGAQADGPATEGALTRREQQILALIVGGASATEIAGQLAISPLTARKHRENLMRKLDVHNTAELVTYAVRNGLMAR